MPSRAFPSTPRQGIRLAIRLLVSAMLVMLTGAPMRAAPSGDRVDLGMATGAQSRQQATPILGAAFTILADGTAPWEDRPIEIPGFGTLPGTFGVADPGDDRSPYDRVVRSWDVIAYRLALSIREGSAEDIVAEARLTGPATWDAQQLSALELSTCSGGATLHDEGQRLRCVVGRLDAPPAVTVALDLTARVSGSASQGAVITAEATVRATDVLPDRDRARCPIPQDEGCDATAPNVFASAAPAAELRKYLLDVTPRTVDGVLGRSIEWRLDAVLGADGDVRGTSSLVGGPWTLPDWWLATGRGVAALDLPVKLLGCTDRDEGATWSCAQPGGDGTPLEVVLETLDLSALMTQRMSSSLPKVVGSLEIELWVPEADLLATEWDVTFENCFATAIGQRGQSLWAPTDAQGQPNLGGLPEPPANNCAAVVLPVPRPNRPGGGGGGGAGSRPRPPGNRNPGRPRPPGATPTPVAVVAKRYTPIGSGDGVAEGTEFAAEVSVRVLADEPVPDVIACDKWDNRTHTLRDGGVSGVSLWWRNDDGELEPMDPDNVIVEFARGPWGRQVPDHISVGERWYRQAVSGCADSVAIAPPGWATADEVDFLNRGTRTIDAREVNMVRARFVDPVPPGVEVWLEVLLRAESNPAGAWLMNYGAGAWGPGSRVWRSEECWGATRRSCPEPAPGARGKPGPLGDMLVHVGVPVWLVKQNDPPAPDGVPIILAGEKAAFTLRASTFPKPDDPPPPDYPPGASAVGVLLTDTLPAGMTYVVGSATISSEDIDGDGVLDPGEDSNGNGRIDVDVPFEPVIDAPALDGTTTLVWRLGDLPYERESAVIRYEAHVSRLLPAGTALTNWAGVAAEGDAPRECVRPRRRNDMLIPFALQPGPSEVVRGLCAWAQVIVANAAAAQVEKVPLEAVVEAGEAMVYRLGFANLTGRAAEWFDAVDILPRQGEPRVPASRIASGLASVEARVDGAWPPIEVWASATDPDALDTAGGGARDGLVDPVSAWGAGARGGEGLGASEWPCLLADVGTRRCGEIRAPSEVTALRFWGADPQPGQTGTHLDSFLPIGGQPRFVDVTLRVPGSQPGDLAHNAWGGRFEGLPLPVFDGAVIQVPPLATPPPTQTSTPLPTGTATRTGTPAPSATATATPTQTPTQVASATSTTAARSPIYLPVTLRRPCAPQPIDAVLVIDVSSSMLRSAGDGGSKLDAVMRAARAFVEGFDPERSQGRVAIVVFNERAWMTQPMTDDPERIDAAIADLPQHIREGTRLDLGLLAGAEALGDAEPGRWRAMVFLTDGLPNRVPTPAPQGRQEDTVLAAAAEVRGRDVEIHAVGYGRVDAQDLADRISPELLRQIAGDAARYHETDDAGGLAEVFREIASTIGCGRDVGWP